MNHVFASTILALAATVSLASAGPASPPAPIATRAGTLDLVGANADYAIVGIGTQAPEFSFAAQGCTLRLRDLRAQGSVLLLFAPDDARLVALERERAQLLAIGVVPVAVLDQRAGACAATARRLGVGYSIVPDPRRVIGAQFNALDPSSRADAPAWFVLDRSGRVCDLAHLAWPGRPWTEVAARALGLPGPDAAAPASFGRH